MTSETTSKEKNADEAELIASAKSGDQTAFETLVKSYERLLKFHIKSIGSYPWMYDDLYQEGLIGLLKAVRSYDGKSSSFANFASLCVRNSIISGVRKYSNQTAKTVSLPEYLADEETSPSAEDVILDSFRVKTLYKRVYEVLSPFERTVFEMYLSDMSYETIAFVTGKSVKSATNAVFRIRTKLKQIIGNADAYSND